jgi:predicted transcriptional regulator
MADRLAKLERELKAAQEDLAAMAGLADEAIGWDPTLMEQEMGPRLETLRGLIARALAEAPKGNG